MGDRCDRYAALHDGWGCAGIKWAALLLCHVGLQKGPGLHRTTTCDSPTASLQGRLPHCRSPPLPCDPCKDGLAASQLGFPKPPQHPTRPNQPHRASCLAYHTRTRLHQSALALLSCAALKPLTAGQFLFAPYKRYFCHAHQQAHRTWLRQSSMYPGSCMEDLTPSPFELREPTGRHHIAG